MGDSDIRLFEDLVRTYQAGIRAFVRSLGVYRDAVDDMSQEVFLTAWREMDRYDKERDFGPWLRGIARNLVMNERRKVARRSRIMSERLTEILDTNYPEEESAVKDEAATAALLRDCLDELPSRSRELLLAHGENNEDSSVLGARIGKSAVATRQAISRIRRLVRECVDSKRESIEA